MNENELFRAFQEIDPEILKETEKNLPAQIVYEQENCDMPRRIRMQHEESRIAGSRHFHLLTGAAAVLAVCSIGYFTLTALHSDGTLTAHQPADSAAATTVIEADSGAAETMQQTAHTPDATAPYAMATLPPEDFVEITETTTAEIISEPEYDPDGKSYYMTYENGDQLIAYLSATGMDMTQTLELPEDDRKIRLDLTTAWQSMSSRDTVQSRIYLMQDGEYLPFSLKRDEEPALSQVIQTPVTHLEPYQDENRIYRFVSERMRSKKTDLWLTPKKDSRYSMLTAVIVFFHSDESSGTENYYNVSYASIALYNENGTTVSRSPVAGEMLPVDAQSYAVAAAEDYIDFPEAFMNSNQQFEGLGIGRKMNYEENRKNRYVIDADNREYTEDGPPVISRDELYCKMHYNYERHYWENEEAGSSMQLIMDGMFLTVLCDGVPLNCFDGKNVLRIDTPTGDKTLNKLISLDDSIENGVHSFVIIAVPDWRRPYDATKQGLCYHYGMGELNIQ